MQTDSPFYVLGCDTSSPVQSLALLKDGVPLAQQSISGPANHSVSLLTSIDVMLTQQRLSAQDVGLFCAGLGPGSFTALRVGLATLKGLCLGANAPIVGISSLAAQAWRVAAAQPGVVVWSGIDARREEVYAGAYKVEEDGTLITVVADAAYAPAVLAQTLKDASADAPLVWIGHKTQTYPALSDLGANVHSMPVVLTGPQALAIAHVGLAYFIKEGGMDCASLEPNYIRPSDAEISLEKRMREAKA